MSMRENVVKKLLHNGCINDISLKKNCTVLITCLWTFQNAQYDKTISLLFSVSK